jgi:hypothetical protein
VHHVALSANVPVGEFVAWLSSLGADVVIEFVSKEDAMSRRLLRNKEDVFPDYTLPSFEQVFGHYFTIARRDTLGGGTRTLFYGRARTGRG